MMGFYHNNGSWYWESCWCGASASGFNSLREAVYDKHVREHR